MIISPSIAHISYEHYSQYLFNPRIERAHLNLPISSLFQIQNTLKILLNETAFRIKFFTVYILYSPEQGSSIQYYSD